MPFHAKRRTGCPTCRQRRVRCDETRPACQNCQRTSRQCPGYSHAFAQVTVRDILNNRSRPTGVVPSTPRIVSGLHGGEHHGQAFDFYRHATASALAGALDYRLWYVTVLQHSETDQAVRHAVTALGYLSRHSETCDVLQAESCSCQAYQASISQYSKAVMELRKRTHLRTGDSHPVVTYALFACLESLLGNTHQVRELADVAVSLLQTGAMLSDDQLFLEFFQRLRIYFHLVWQGYRLPSSRIAEDATPTQAFANLSEARQSLHMLIGDFITLVNYPVWVQGHSPDRTEANYVEALREQSDLLRRTSLWHEACDALSEQEKSSEAFAILECYLILADLWLRVVVQRDEEAFSRDITPFSNIIARAATHVMPSDGPAGRAQLFNFGLGWMDPLYYTIQKCRNVDLRQQALQLLAALPRQEGIWTHDKLLVLAKRIVGWESLGELFQLVTAAPDFVEDGCLKFRADFLCAEKDDNVPPRRFSETLVIR